MGSCFWRTGIVWILCVLVLCAFLSISVRAGAQELSSILSILEQSLSMIQSGSGHITVENRYTELGRKHGREKARKQFKAQIQSGELPKNHADYLYRDFIKEFFYAFEGPKVRCDAKWVEDNPDGRRLQWQLYQAFDGEVVYSNSYHWSLPEDFVEPSGFLDSTDRYAAWLTQYDPRYYTGLPLANKGVGKNKQSYLDLLKSPSAQLLGKELLDGQTCEVVEVTGGLLGETYRFWLLESANYLPVRIEGRKGEGRLARVVSRSYRSYGNGIWLLQKAVQQGFGEPDASGRTPLLGEHIVTVHDDFQVNIDVPDSLFKITFLEGQPVVDYRTGELFRWGAR